ncbi:Nn.00g030150.m01.CDS01 [Neocucurbitaria sp. VM-36]
MAMVSYNRDAYFYVYEIREDEMTSVDDNTDSVVSDRLQMLLESAREANREERLPLEDFLARLQQEQEVTGPAPDESTELSEEEVTSPTRKYVSKDPDELPNEATTTVSQGTQTRTGPPHVERALFETAKEVRMVSQATQTDFGSQFAQELLEKSAKAASARSFQAGKWEGLKGTEQSKSTDNSERPAARGRQDEAQRFEEENSLEPQHDDSLSYHTGQENGSIERIERQKMDVGQIPSETIPRYTRTEEKIVVDMPPVSHKAPSGIPRKEKIMPADDPFRSLLGLVRKR